MTAPLPLMTEDEVRRAHPEGEEGCFGSLRTERGHLPLEAMDVNARVIGLFAHTSLEQTFVNTHDVPLEATYIFPLPDRAAVTRFVLEVAGRVVEGTLKERGAARREYAVAIQQGHRASIAEEERPGVFTLRVGNLMPGEKARVRLELSGPLPYVDGEATYRFPLVVAPRYMPGTPLDGDDVGDGVARDTDAVPDASRLSPPVLLPGYPNPVRLALSVEIDPASLPLSEVRSSLHAAVSERVGERLRVTVLPGERLNRDFLLRFKLGDEAARTSLLLCPGEKGGEGTLLLTLLPPVASGAVRPRDVVFVLDRSGSMSGWKMVAARRAVARMIDSLRASDRFSLLAFDNVVEEPSTLPAGLSEATDRNRFRATEWLAKLEARGGTEMARPLSRAADLLSGGYLERDRVLVFVTDGQVGNEGQLLTVLGEKLKGARVFPLGIDQAVNAGFLNRLAALGGAGEAELVESEDRLDEVLERAHRRIDTPLWSELSVEGSGLSLVKGSLAPSRLPDLFEGAPAFVLGRYRGEATGAVVVKGRARDGGHTETVRAEVSDNPAIRTAWAKLRLRDLEDRFDIGREDRRALEREIVEVSLAHSVLCRFTAFVAVDRAEVVNQGGHNHRVTQAVEVPAGWAEGAAAPGGAMSGGAAKVMRARAAPMPSPAAPPALRALSFDEGPEELDEDEAFTPPAAPAKKGRSLGDAFGAIGRAVGDAIEGLVRKEEAPAAETAAEKGAPISIADRLAPLVERLRARGTLDEGGRRRLLEDLLAALRSLVDALPSRGASDEERARLDGIAQQLRPLVGMGTLAEVDRALDEAAAALDGYGPRRASSGREGFWR